MKQCPICGREIDSKRKDARFCKNPACRKKAYQDRKEQAANVPIQVGSNKASVVVSFPDGSRWLLELTPLHAIDGHKLPTLTQVESALSENRSGSDPALPEALPVPNHGGGPGDTALQNSSELFSQTEKETVITPEVVPTAPSAGSSDPGAGTTRSSSSGGPELRTVELFFVDDRGHRLPFAEAVLDRGLSGWRVRRSARGVLGTSRADGYGLGGTPGRWQDFYPRRLPSEFGLDRDLAVLYVDAELDRVLVAEPELLREALGINWRERLREAADRRQPAGGR